MPIVPVMGLFYTLHKENKGTKWIMNNSRTVARSTKGDVT